MPRRIAAAAAAAEWRLVGRTDTLGMERAATLADGTVSPSHCPPCVGKPTRSQPRTPLVFLGLTLLFCCSPRPVSASPAPPPPVTRVSLLTMNGGSLSLACDASGNLFIAEKNNHRVAVLLLNGSLITWVGGTDASLQGCARRAQLSLHTRDATPCFLVSHAPATSAHQLL